MQAEVREQTKLTMGPGQSAQPARTPGSRRGWARVPGLGAPPLPREHGGWVMLAAPMLINLLAAPAAPLLPGLLLLIAAISAFGLQHSVGLMLRRRGPEGVTVWPAGCLALLLASGLPLLTVYHRLALLPLAGLAAGAFGLKTVLSHSRRRFDRTVGGEILGMLALTLTGPAASVITRGRLDGDAWGLWAGMVLYFTSGVFFVNLLLAAARCKGSLDARSRWRVGRGHLIYHVLLAVLVGYVGTKLSQPAAFLFMVAYVPALIRALWAWIDLNRCQRLNLKRVGWGELLYALWFAGCWVGWLRIACRRT
jgi:hypothetical protein